MSYPGTVDEVIAMYLAPSHPERHFGQFVVEDSPATSMEDQHVLFAGTVRPELIPTAIAHFVKSDLCTVSTEGWMTNEARVSSRTSATVDGVPVSVEATSALAGTEEGCVCVITGNASV